MTKEQSIEKLLKKATSAMRKDMLHIFHSVKQKKLSPTSARDLVAYIKLLTDLAKQAKVKEQEVEDDLATKSEEELKALAKELL